MKKYGKIKKISLANNLKVFYEIGNEVYRIIDNSHDYEEGICYEFQVIDREDNVIVELINCPVIIERENE